MCDFKPKFCGLLNAQFGTLQKGNLSLKALQWSARFVFPVVELYSFENNYLFQLALRKSLKLRKTEF